MILGHSRHPRLGRGDRIVGWVWCVWIGRLARQCADLTDLRADVLWRLLARHHSSRRGADVLKGHVSWRLCVAGVAVLLFGVAPVMSGPARGSSIETQVDAFPDFTYRADPGESNQVTFTRGGLSYVVTDLGAAISSAPPSPDCIVAVHVAECNGILADWFFHLGDHDDTYTGVGAAEVFGGAGADTLRGGGTLHGGPDGDRLEGDSGPDDQLFGDEGDDLILSDDGAADQVSCGDGLDAVFADALDVVDATCEQVTVNGGSLARVRVGVSSPDPELTAKCSGGVAVRPEPQPGPALNGPSCELVF